jgi:hypothetical protein
MQATDLCPMPCRASPPCAVNEALLLRLTFLNFARPTVLQVEICLENNPGARERGGDEKQCEQEAISFPCLVSSSVLIAVPSTRLILFHKMF